MAAVILNTARKSYLAQHLQVVKRALFDTLCFQEHIPFLEEDNPFV